MPTSAERLARCPSCDGYGWFAEEMAPDTSKDCDWCGGLGYVYRDGRGLDRLIPANEYPRLAQQLENLDEERLRELGYRGKAQGPPRPD